MEIEDKVKKELDLSLSDLINTARIPVVIPKTKKKKVLEDIKKKKNEK